MKHTMKFALGAAAALMLTTAAQASDIDNTVGGISTNIYAFGSPHTSTYGQTFDAGGASLNSFSLFLNGRVDGSGPLDFKGYIGTWDGTKLGSVLYSSGIQTVNDGPLTEFMFNTGNLAVTAGTTYIAFLSISDLAAQADGTFYMPFANDNIAGGFVYMNNGTNFGQLSTDAWQTRYSNNDVYLKASFGAVPEPASWALMILGFGLVGGTMRRRRTAVRVTYA